MGFMFDNHPLHLKDSERKSVCVTGGQMDVSPGQTTDEPVHPVNIPRREKDFQGMLEYKKEDELKLVKNLILGNTHAHSHTLYIDRI